MRFTADPELPPGLYSHFKGGSYAVLGVAEHTETLEKLVIYIPQDGQYAGLLRTRPLGMFLETLDRPEYPGWDRRFRCVTEIDFLGSLA